MRLALYTSRIPDLDSSSSPITRVEETCPLDGAKRRKDDSCLYCFTTEARRGKMGSSEESVGDVASGFGIA